jgi:4-amino-4-deoxy-L-arabinose transferase-like glycosyltransferase
MNKKYIPASLSLVVLILAYALLWQTWIHYHQLFVSLVIGALGVLAVARLNRNEAAALQEDAPAPSRLAAPPQVALTLCFGAAGLCLIWVAHQAFYMERWSLLFLSLGLAVLPLSFVVRQNDEFISPRHAKWLLLLVILGACLFRFYKAGEIPVGLVEGDESMIYVASGQILDGLRPSFIAGDGVGIIQDGAVPFYLQALVMKVFGHSIFSYRLEGILTGIVLVLLIYGLAVEFVGKKTGLCAAAFMALSFWPVTVSRVQYLLGESMLMFLLYLYLFMRGMKKDSALLFVLSGVFFGFSLNAYKANQIGVGLVPALALLYYLLHPGRRLALRHGALPFVVGALLGLAPLLLWAYQGPKTAYSQYFSSLNAEHIVGGGMSQTGFLHEMDAVLGRIFPMMPAYFKMFISRGPLHPWHFPTWMPVMEKGAMFFFLVGAVVCVIRRRSAGYVFMLLWFFLGLYPALAAAPGGTINERRSILAMLAIFMVAGLGLMVTLDLLARVFRENVRNALVLVLVLVFFSDLGVYTWKRYFHDYQLDSEFLIRSHANECSWARAIRAEHVKKPVYVLSMWRSVFASWTQPGGWGWPALWAMNPGTQFAYAQADPGYYSTEGLFGALRQAPLKNPEQQPQDILVSLDPFHFYLEPLLVNSLKGKLVKEVPTTRTKDGINEEGMVMAVDPKVFMKLVRLSPVNPADLDRLKTRYLYTYTSEELVPPESLGGRGVVSQNSDFSKQNLEAMQAYERDPGRWKVLRHQDFKIPDPYFWTTARNLPGAMAPPERLRASWGLSIPKDGMYCLGASSNITVKIKIDGKKVFRFNPETSTMSFSARDGLLGEPVFLKAGMHHLEVEQIMLSFIDNFNHLIRLVWKQPGQEMETLPLEHLFPSASKGE